METVIGLLIHICIVAAVVWLIIWVLGQVGVPLPAQVIKILWVIFALICILLIYRALVAGGGAPLLGRW